MKEEEITKQKGLPKWKKKIEPQSIEPAVPVRIELLSLFRLRKVNDCMDLQLLSFVLMDIMKVSSAYKISIITAIISMISHCFLH